ncbi:MAG: hypothetical protein R6U04_03330 [Bacteroidales bacterium]
MRWIAANYLIPVTSTPIKNGILEIDDNGIISKIIDPGDQLREMSRVEFYNGVLIPGFINCHCHLELSALKGLISKGLSLSNFIVDLYKKRQKLSKADIETAISYFKNFY